MQNHDPLASSSRNSSSRISLENAKTKTWHVGWIILLLLVLASIATYAIVRVLRHGVVAPVSEVSKNLDGPKE